MNETDWNDPALVRRLCDEAPVRDAAETGQRLMAMWPLTKPLYLENDTKYAEELQVRLTQEFAKLIIGDPQLAQSVTLADADFVYEGAESIPGRPQEVVDALIAANDAYDAAADYSDDGDAKHIVAAAQKTGARVDYGDDAANSDAEGFTGPTAEFAAALDAGDAFVDQIEQDAEKLGDPVERVSVALCAVGLAFYGAMQASRALAESTDGNLVAGMISSMLYCNELGERHGVPRVFFDADTLAKLNRPMEPTQFVRMVAHAASLEWSRHKADVVWDPDAAKSDAEEADRKREREELAKKFQ